MKKYTKCTECRTYHFSNEKCPQEYTVFHDDYLDEEGRKIRGYGFEDAAEEYAKYYNRDDRGLLYNDIDIEVEDKDGLRKRFTLSAEPTIDYCIKEIK